MFSQDRLHVAKPGAVRGGTTNNGSYEHGMRMLSFRPEASSSAITRAVGPGTADRQRAVHGHVVAAHVLRQAVGGHLQGQLAHQEWVSPSLNTTAGDITSPGL